MEEKNMTALVSCFARAYHAKNYKFKIFDDPLAERILKGDYIKISDNMKKGILFFKNDFKGSDEEALRYIVDNQLSPSVLGRSIFTEKLLNNSKKLGAKQYLILASGYDTSFYKNKDLQVFEVDTSNMINDKIRRLEELNIEHDNVKYIEANFKDNNWKKRILKSNFDINKKTFCSMLGISYYLTKKEFEQFIHNVSKILTTGSEIILDYPNNIETESGTINKNLASGAKEEMKSKYSINYIEKICEKNNLLIYESLTNNEMTNNYFYNYNTLNPDNRIIAPENVSYCLLVKR